MQVDIKHFGWKGGKNISTYAVILTLALIIPNSECAYTPNLFPWC
jgi:hypothetical protein